MALENFLIIASLILGVVSYVCYRYCTENVYLKYKEQRVGPAKAKEVRK
jgi:hypothetical protein